jgi:putative DNA primase/helicase
MNPSSIPEQLRERDQWLLFDRDADTPRRPHWDGDFTISWSDPDAWHPFEEALAKSQSVESWGVGYVTAANNDAHPLGVMCVIDLDGCATPDDSPKEWLPSLEPFADRDAYLEWSASHEEPGDSGIHIPVAGTPPDWWRDVQLDGGDHEGVDVLANKFCVFTGDEMDGISGGEIPAWDQWVDEWLADAYEALTGETAPPRKGSTGTFMDHDKSGSYDGDSEWLDEETVVEALDQISPNCGYAKWRNIGFGLTDYFDQRTAKQLFDDWSRGGSKYDREAEKLIEDIASRGSGGVTIGTVIYHAKEAGWSPSFGGDDYKGTPSPRELVARHSDEYDHVSEVPEDIFATDRGVDSAELAEDSPGDSDAYQKDAERHGDDATAQATDGGAAADTPTAGGPQTDFSGPAWEHIRGMFAAAENADERQTPRFEAAMKLHDEDEFVTLRENDQLYVYKPELGIYNDDGEGYVRSQLTTGLKEQYRSHAMREGLDHIRGRTMAHQDDLGGPEGMIAARNCVIDLYEQTSRDHSPDYRFLSRLGCDFDPSARAPRWHEFLGDVVPSEKDRQKVQEFAGYTLHHWGLPHHKALFLVGPTASGKSTFLDAINAMLGEGTVTSLTPQQLTTERFSGAELFGKWGNIRNDIPAATVKNTGMFKEIIGGDPIKAERKRKDPFHFEPKAKHLYSANELPSTDTDDEAFYRRILLVPFPETVPKAERDRTLDDTFQGEELSGILNWALEGLQRLLANDAFTGDRSPGQTQDTWQKWADSVSRFESVALTSGVEPIPKSEVYAAYLEFCRQEGMPSDTQHSMTRVLKQEGLTDGRAHIEGDRHRVFENVELTSRGRQLLEDAQARTRDKPSESSAPTGLSGWD